MKEVIRTIGTSGDAHASKENRNSCNTYT